MVVDIVPQQQLTELFTTNHSQHRSSSSSSTHRRSSNTLNQSSSSTSSNQTTMTNGHRFMTEDLGKKAEQILGHARSVCNYPRQNSLDLNGQYPIRLNISESKPIPTSRTNSSNTASSTNVSTSQPTSAKTKCLVTVEQLVPLIFQLVSTPKLSKFPEMISRSQNHQQTIDNVLNSREMTVAFHRQNVVQLSEDENEDEDDDQNKNQNSVLTEIAEQIHNKTNVETNSNENPGQYENQTETEHSGQCSSRCEDEDDSEDDDSDNKEAAHSDAENDDQNNSNNPSTLSLMYFISRNDEPTYDNGDSLLKQSPESMTSLKKRSISPSPSRRDDDNRVHNCEDHQNKRKKLLIKRALLKSFVSSVNTKIDLKRPSLPITIPTYLLIDESNKSSKRNLNGSFKQETNVDVNDNSLTQLQHNGQQKKNKNSHVYEKNFSKQIDSTATNTVKTDVNSSIVTTATTPTIASSSNETDHQTTRSLTTTTTLNFQPKKDKPTANVRPLQQSTPMENLSSTNGSNPSENSTRSIAPTSKAKYIKLKNMSKTELTGLARKLKRQADSGKRTTFSEAREAMSLYLESVCYFVQCANVETKLDQKLGLLSTTLTMLQQLVCNHQKLFCVSNQSSDILFNIRQKFLLINYWIQSLIHHLQFNTNLPTIERPAAQVNEYFTQLKSSTSTTKSNPSTTTPTNDSNPISPLSVNSQTSASDSSVNQTQEQHRFLYDFSKVMLSSYYSTYYWNKAERLTRDKTLKDFTEQLLKQNQNRHLSRDDPPLEFLLYMFDAIELLRVSVA